MSSGSESDDDFVPGEPEQVSEEDSADEETDLQFEKELEHKSNKRKAAEKNTGKKRRRTRNNAHEVEEKEEKVLENDQNEELDPEEQKKRDDDLWAMFLEGTDTKPKPKTEIKESTTPSKSSNISSNTQKPNKAEDDSKEREKRIFEFAGETIIVENNTIKERIKSTDLPTIANTLGGSSSQPTKPGGLSSVLGHINRKNKLSTLEVSKLDWETYKRKEGIEEEVKNFNKGKDGYLERQDFLQRADLRQYEIERDLRMKRRSNR